MLIFKFHVLVSNIKCNVKNIAINNNALVKSGLPIVILFGGGGGHHFNGPMALWDHALRRDPGRAVGGSFLI